MHIYYGFKIASWALMPFNQGIVRHNKTTKDSSSHRNHISYNTILKSKYVLLLPCLSRQSYKCIFYTYLKLKYIKFLLQLKAIFRVSLEVNWCGIILFCIQEAHAYKIFELC